NNWNESDVFDISYTRVNNVPIAFYKLDKATPLTDTDNDTRIDTGTVAGFGATYQFYIMVTVPANASDHDSDLAIIYANSSLNTSVFDTARINTTARVLVTYKDAVRTIENTTFLVTETVYARAHSLSVSTVYYEWLDPNGTIIRISPDIIVSAQDDADDFLATNINMMLGNWTIILFNAQNDAEIARTIFYLLDATPPTITPAGCTPNPANAFATVGCSASITDNVGIDTRYANVTLPNGTTIVQTLSCTGTGLSQQCSFSFNKTVIPGTYNVTWFANDTSNNIAIKLENFTVPDRNPTVTLVNPPAGYVDTTPLFNITFNCSATDDFGLVNISLYITNSTNGGFMLSNTTPVSGFSASVGWTLQLISGVYTWNCVAYDNGNNSDWGENRTISNVTAAAPTIGGGGGGGGGSRVADIIYSRVPAPEEKPLEPPTKISDIIKKRAEEEAVPEVQEPAPVVEEKEKLAEEKARIVLPTILMLIFIILFITWYYWWYILGGKRRKKDYIKHKPYDVPVKKLEGLDQEWVRMVKKAERQVKEKTGIVKEFITEKPFKPIKTTEPVKPIKPLKIVKQIIPAMPKIKAAERTEAVDQEWLRMIKNAKRVVMTKKPSRPKIPAIPVQIPVKTRILPTKENIIEKLPKIKMTMPKIDADRIEPVLKLGAAMIDRVKQVEQAIKTLKPEKKQKTIERAEKTESAQKTEEKPREKKVWVAEDSKERREEVIGRLQKAMKFKDRKPELKPIVLPKIEKQETVPEKEEKKIVAEEKTSQDPVIDKLKKLYKL
ncbi:hypothetical protein KY325_00635, partial [Candidatus Woesearchaeota archaeon]|nr:hypothetical protein [Candidatus Woesearchaeota archaeon]